MKIFGILLAVVLAFAAPQTAYANMGAPAESDIASTITFEKNNEIAVLSETLDITVMGEKANIRAYYVMKNTAETAVKTPVMFVSPNIEENGTTVQVNGENIDYTSEHYYLSTHTPIRIDDWKFKILTNNNPENREEVDTVNFELSFEPGEEVSVMVSYTYSLGGYLEQQGGSKYGFIEYYLTPANSWKDFENLTINLYLDETFPVIGESNLEFNKIAPRTYQYISDTLPEENLTVQIGESFFPSLITKITNPYLLILLQPVILLVLAVAAVVLIIKFLKKKTK